MSKATSIPAITTKGYTRKMTAQVHVKPLDEGGDVVLIVNGNEVPLGFKVTLLNVATNKKKAPRLYTRSDQPGEVYGSVDMLLEDEIAKLGEGFKTMTEKSKSRASRTAKKGEAAS